MSIQKIQILVFLCRLFLHRCYLPDQIHSHLGNVFNGFFTVFDKFSFNNSFTDLHFSSAINTLCFIIFLKINLKLDLKSNDSNFFKSSRLLV